MDPSRQLAAIMFTDIAGYTAMMGDDEKRAFEILKQNRNLQKPLIEQFGGKWIKELGDGVLASFSTVTDAVSSAYNIIKGCERIEGLKLRIGIHLGEVLFENGDVFGDGVNIASRLQALAPVGRIWVSESVYKNVSNKKDIQTRFVRAEILKHVKEPVLIYEIITDASKEPKNIKEIDPIKRFSGKSLAILPFTDMSPTYDQEYLGDGLAEELINILSQLKELKVIGRTSSFSFKGTKTDLKTIGQMLNAENILEGSVQKSGNRVRITAQLINAADGYHIWSQRYDREMVDIFALQDDLAAKISDHLKLTLLQQHETTAEKRSSTNLKAYDLLLKGEFYYKKYTPEGFKKAIDFFNKALEVDPNYADAWCYLGISNFEMHGWVALTNERRDMAINCANKAISLDISCADAYFLLAVIHLNYGYDWEKVESGITLGNKYTTTPFPLRFIPLEAWYRAMIYGDFDFAIQHIQKGLEHDPLNLFYQFHLAHMYLHGSRDYKKTRSIFNNLLELGFQPTITWRPMCLSYLYEGNYELAEEYARKAYDNPEERGLGAANLIMCLAASGKKSEAEEFYQLVKKTLTSSEFPPFLHVKATAHLGKFDEAFEYLDKAISENNYWLFTLKVSPEWDPLRADPRFEKVLERMKFPK